MLRNLGNLEKRAPYGGSYMTDNDRGGRAEE